MEMQRRNGGRNYTNQALDRMESPSVSKVFSNGSSSSSSSLKNPVSDGLSSGGGGLGYIEHTVTKFDTLAGVAIKYGVEVADVKRMNGLTTDLQMFSRKTLHIPLPGRHPPSPIMSNGYDIHGPKRSDTTPPNRRRSDLLDSIKSLKLSSSSPRTVSPSMDALRDYYGLKPTNPNGIDERSNLEHGPNQLHSSDPPHGLHRKCKSLACELTETGAVNDETTTTPVTNGEKPDSDTWYDNLMRRRRSEIDLQNPTPETMLKPDTTNTTTAFSPAAGKGLALRPKAASRTTSDADGPQNMPPPKLGDSVISDGSNGVKKSSSSPSFQESDSNGNGSTSTSSIWPTSMLNLTADLQALSTAAITRPIFDGLPKPMSGRKNKAAID
ncbi:putative LysM domain-containing protein [Helianthus annuus]|nr:putative LysM domain-containing protein [Helianthus annuus]